MTKKNKRSVKVYGTSGYKYKTTPTIMLKGQWLAELGFEIGDYLSISCEDGKIIITSDAEKAALMKAKRTSCSSRRADRFPTRTTTTATRRSKMV